MAHYHKRSNVESTFSMMKRKFGDALRSKTDVAMVDEKLCVRFSVIISWFSSMKHMNSELIPYFGPKMRPDTC